MTTHTLAVLDTLARSVDVLLVAACVLGWLACFWLAVSWDEWLR